MNKNPSVKIAFERAVSKLKRNYLIGQSIPKDRIPKEIKQEFNPTNLYRYDLIRKHPGWRMLYTLTGDGKIKILVVVLQVLNHHKYDRMFN